MGEIGGVGEGESMWGRRGVGEIGCRGEWGRVSCFWVGNFKSRC